MIQGKTDNFEIAEETVFTASRSEKILGNSQNFE